MHIPAQSKVFVSVIVPTLNEVENIDTLLPAILAQAGDGLDLEILISDGGSTDGTIERVRAWEGRAPVRLISGNGSRGLAGDVLAAAKFAAADVVVVMDADLSHPPDRIAEIVRPVADGDCDMAVGSRYVPGGSTPDWPWSRRLLSRLGGLLAWPLTELRDPMSGFFAVRRQRLLAVDPHAAGFKIGLELIAEGGGALRVTEVPITFRDRVRGQSKIGIGQMAAYLRRLLVLAGGAASQGNIARFATVGLIGMAVDLATFEMFLRAGTGLLTAHVVSFSIATVSNYLLNSRWAFASRREAGARGDPELYTRFLAVCLLAFAIRGGVLAAATMLLGLPPQAAILLAIGAAAMVNYLGCAFFVFPSVSPRVPHDIRWRIAAIGVVGYVVVLRLLFIGLADLVPEEAYYWNYAQHLDIGYLDHPPMVAWLIWLGTSLFGDTEFGVRIGAYAGWLATGFFSFHLARNLFGKSAAFVTLLLVAALPFYFATGLVMTPDAPLTAAWAGALYFLERALLGERRRAWWGVGVCIGLGMLSKYTIGLLGLATLAFMLMDSRSRRWLLRPEPYLAAGVSLLLFSPVIVWNMQHDWASFAFQSSRRVQASVRFSLPALIASAGALLTPLGLFAAVTALSARFTPAAGEPGSDRIRRSNFIAVYTLLPLAVFVVFSLSHTTKLNWIGPLWLAVLPAIGAGIVAATEQASGWRARARRLWVPTLAGTLVIYGLGLHYVVLGFPGAGLLADLPLVPIGWRQFGIEAAAIERDVEQATGDEPLLVGMDKYFVASQLAFYSQETGDKGRNSVGRVALGEDSLMYNYWFRFEDMRGKNVIMFAFKRDQIDDPALKSRFLRLGSVSERDVTKDGKLAGRFYYRVGYGVQAGSSFKASLN